MSESSSPSVLMNTSPANVQTDPFSHVILRDALPSNLYEELASEFPPLEIIAEGQGRLSWNQAIRMNCRRALANARVSTGWKRFFEQHTSTDYWRDVTRLFAAHWRREFPDLEERVGRRFEDWRVLPRGSDGDADVRLDCQFVMNTPVVKKSSVKTPHVDKYDKVF